MVEYHRVAMLDVNGTWSLIVPYIEGRLIKTVVGLKLGI